MGPRAAYAPGPVPVKPLRKERTAERLGALRERDVRAAVRLHVRDLARQVADAVAARDRRDLERAQHAERATLTVDERAAGVTGDARGDRVDGVVPAAGVLTEAHALLRRQLRDAEAQRGVAVGEDLVGLRDRVGQAG